MEPLSFGSGTTEQKGIALYNTVTHCPLYSAGFETDFDFDPSF